MIDAFGYAILSGQFKIKKFVSTNYSNFIFKKISKPLIQYFAQYKSSFKTLWILQFFRVL